MSAKQFFNGLSTNAPGAITATQQAIVCQSTSTWSPTGDYIVRIDGTAPGTTTAIFEYVLVTANAQGTGTITCTRGQDSTQGQAFAANATLTPDVSGKMFNEAFARIDQTSAQAFSGPITVPSSGGVALPVTSYGSMPIKIDDILVGTDSRYPAATAQVTFLNTSNSGTNLLPTGFRGLEVRWYARGDAAAVNNINLLLRFNNDSGNNYDYEWIHFNAASTTPAETLTTGSILLGRITAATATANYFAIGSAEIRHYSGAVGNKLTASRYSVAFDNGTGNQESGQVSGKWRTAGTPITRLDLLPASGNLINGSLFELWGHP